MSFTHAQMFASKHQLAELSPFQQAGFLSGVHRGFKTNFSIGHVLTTLLSPYTSQGHMLYSLRWVQILFAR